MKSWAKQIALCFVQLKKKEENHQYSCIKKRKKNPCLHKTGFVPRSHPSSWHLDMTGTQFYAKILHLLNLRNKRIICLRTDNEGYWRKVLTNILAMSVIDIWLHYRHLSEKKCNSFGMSSLNGQRKTLIMQWNDNLRGKCK